jgi:hypothetical protein
MSYLLWNVLRDTWQELGQLQVGNATSGSTTTVVDSKLINTGKDDGWNNGAVIILEDSAGGNAAPEGEFARVVDYSDSTGTLTIDALTAAVAGGDLYGLVSEYYPLRQMIELVNLALRGLGDIGLVDTATLETATLKTEYAAALAWKRRPPRQVDIQTISGDADDHRWQRIYDWEFVPAAAGATGLIVFRTQLEDGRNLRVWYEDAHPRVNAFNDVIHETVHPALVVAAVVEKALVWQVSRLEGEHPFMMQRLNDAKNELERMKLLYPIWKPMKNARMLLAGSG